jgi:FAD/FMN-containing dehydrogenase
VSTVVRDGPLSQLEESVRGDLILPGDEHYELARRVFNGMIDRRPRLIARCLGPADVRAVVDYAREADLPVAVRGGGHNVAGHGTCDDGVLIDCSRMRSVRVDAASHTVRADPGCTWVDFDTETTAHGMATTGGTVGSTGIAGLTLGGGLGFLMGSYGLTCDNLLSADVVTADGRFVTASATEHSDLFWALRGGGGNFGVVTSFEYQLHPLADLLGGLLLYPMDKAAAALRLFRELALEGPDELGCAYAMLTLPDGGPPVAGIAACYNGSSTDGEPVVQPLRDLGPIDGEIGPTTYGQVQRLFAEIEFGLHNYWKGHFIDDLHEDVIEGTVAAFERVTSDHTAILIEAPHGAVQRVPPDATAFGRRDARFNASALSIWEAGDRADHHIVWTREYADMLAPHAVGGYFNYLGHDATAEDIASAFGDERFRRLVEIKTKYDPTNMFRFNQNIAPRT